MYNMKYRFLQYAHDHRDTHLCDNSKESSGEKLMSEHSIQLISLNLKKTANVRTDILAILIPLNTKNTLSDLSSRTNIIISVSYQLILDFE